MKRALLSLLLLLAVAPAPASAAIDPFYRNRMESGVRAFEEGRWEQAAKLLRIACFGHLDEPVALAEGLIQLAIAEGTLGDEDAARRTFSRLVELQERFSAYGAARVPDPVRQQFETLVARLVPPETLRTMDGFQPIAERADVQRLATLPPAQRRTELETRLQAEPGESLWLVELAKLELEARRPQQALGWLLQLPPAALEMPPASCLRQQAASESGSCDQIDLAQPFCRGVPPPVVEFRLECLVEAARWQEASQVLQGLEPELRARRRIARLERRVRKNAGEAAAAPPATESSELGFPASEPAGTAPPPAAPTGEEHAAEPPIDERELEALRQRLAASATSAELSALMSEVESLADRHPGSRQARLLAAEIAYLQSDWPRALAHFRQAGELRHDEVDLAFYHAVALYESGDPAAAAEALRPVASQLERSSFVDAWVERILAAGI